MESRSLEQESLSRSKQDVSIVVPVFNESENILPLYFGIKSALGKLGPPVAIVALYPSCM
jgi:hypothetical protein